MILGWLFGGDNSDSFEILTEETVKANEQKAKEIEAQIKLHSRNDKALTSIAIGTQEIVGSNTKRQLAQGFAQGMNDATKEVLAGKSQTRQAGKAAMLKKYAESVKARTGK